MNKTRCQALISALCVLIFAFGCYSLLGHATRQAKLSSDFTQDYTAGYQLLHGEPIYGESLTRRAKELTGFTGIENFHPPFLSLPFSLLALIPYHFAVIVMAGITLLCFWITVAFVMRELQFGLYAIFIAISLSVLWHPLIETVALGQTSAIIALLLTVGWYLEKRERHFCAGIACGLAALIKLYPAFVGFVFLFRREWTALAGMTGVFCLGMVVTLSFLGSDTIIHYVTTVMPADAAIWGGFPANISVRGTLFPLISRGRWVQEVLDLGGGASVVCLTIEVVMGAGSLLLISRISDFTRAFVCAIVAALLLCPIVWTHNLCLLILPLFLLLRECIAAPQQQRVKVRRLLLLLLLLFSLPTYEMIRNLQEVTDSARLPLSAFLITRAATAGLLLLLFYFAKHQSPVALKVQGNDPRAS